MSTLTIKINNCIYIKKTSKNNNQLLINLYIGDHTEVCELFLTHFVVQNAIEIKLFETSVNIICYLI
jgi:hypothetical protein